jgi:pimeloyl-ACP methyl ester carboxylesterase
MGDPVFDAYYATHFHNPPTPPGVDRNKANLDVRVKLLERIGPAILVGHSTGGTVNWALADARPHLVKGIIAAEPTGPPIHSVDYAKLAYDTAPGQRWGLGTLPLRYDPPVTDPAQLQPVLQAQAQAPGPDQVPCYLQKEPARKLVNLQNIPVLFVSAEASYHRIAGHCIAKWLNQAGGKAEYIHLEDVGIRGNSHLMMLDRNSQDIAKFIGNWIPKNVR